MTEDTQLKGKRQDVVTFAVIDAAGAMRVRGVTEDKARATIAALIEDGASGAPFTLQRTTYVAFTHRDDIETCQALAGQAS